MQWIDMEGGLSGRGGRTKLMWLRDDSEVRESKQALMRVYLMIEEKARI